MTSTFLEPVKSAQQRDLNELIQALQKYFDLMYDFDTWHFDEVFRSTVQLHGFWDGAMAAWTASTYRDILNRRQGRFSRAGYQTCRRKLWAVRNGSFANLTEGALR